MGDTTIRVLLADDHAATRSAVRRVLEAYGLAVCAEANDAESAVRSALREQPDICLLDIGMPGSGITAAATIRRQLPATVVVMLTVSDEDADLFAALRAGAAGYLLKDMDPDRLAAALLGVLDGEAALPRELMARVIDELRAQGTRRVALPGQGRTVELTTREWQVLRLLAQGKDTKAMAEELYVSPVTVRRHISGVLKRLRVSNRADAVRVLQAQAE